MSDHDWTPEDRARHAATLVTEALAANNSARRALVALFRAWDCQAKTYSDYVSAERDGRDLLVLELSNTLSLIAPTVKHAAVLSGIGPSAGSLDCADLPGLLRRLLDASECGTLEEARAKLAEAQADVARLEAAAGGAL